ERGLNGDLGGLQVADLADQDHVRILAKDGPQGRGERQVDFVVDRALHDAVDFVFDRIFRGDDLGVDIVEFGEGGIKRGRLAGAGRTGDEHDAVRLLDDLTEHAQKAWIHADAVERKADVGAVENADDDAFAEKRRQDADAHVDGVAADVQFDAAVLRQAPFGDVEVGHD